MSRVYSEVSVHVCRLLEFGFVRALISFISMQYALDRFIHHTVECVYNKHIPPEVGLNTLHCCVVQIKFATQDIYFLKPT